MTSDIHDKGLMKSLKTRKRSPQAVTITIKRKQ